MTNLGHTVVLLEYSKFINITTVIYVYVYFFVNLRFFRENFLRVYKNKIGNQTQSCQ